VQVENRGVPAGLNEKSLDILGCESKIPDNYAKCELISRLDGSSINANQFTGLVFIPPTRGQRMCRISSSNDRNPIRIGYIF
jgi:hypothetical protein